MCNKYDETIDHIVSGCPELAKTEYIHRHDKAAAYIHWKVCHNFNIKTSEKWYDHQPEAVTENEDVTILWDIPIHTDRKITANRPDIVIKDHKTKTCKFIDMAVPSDRNTSVKVTEKLSKYKDLEIETIKPNVGHENGNDTSYHWSTWSYQKGTRNVSWKNSRPNKHQ